MQNYISVLKFSFFDFVNHIFWKRIIEMATKKHETDAKENADARIQLAVFDMSSKSISINTIPSNYIQLAISKSHI